MTMDQPIWNSLQHTELSTFNGVDSRVTGSLPLRKVLARILRGSQKDKVERLRACQDEVEADEIKKTLTGVTFSGLFTYRNGTSLQEHSGLICCDYDNLEDAAEFRDGLKKYPYVLSAWISPSGDGVKFLIPIRHKDKHLDHWRAIKQVFTMNDEKTKDVSRLCFDSYDPGLWVNKDCVMFEILASEAEKQRQKELSSSINTNTQEIYQNLLKWAEKRSEAFVEGSRNDFVFKLASAFNRAGVNEEEAVSLLVSEYGYQSSGFTASECETAVRGVYKRHPEQFGSAPFEKGEFVDKNTGEIIKDIEAVFTAEDPIKSLIRLEDVKDRMDKIAIEGLVLGESTGFPGLDRHFRHQRGEITIINGYGNFGKSTMLLQLLLIRALVAGRKYVFFTPESHPEENWYITICEMYLGKAWEHTNNEEREESYKFVNDHFFCVYPKDDSPTPDFILSEFMRVIIKHNVDGVIIDPFNQLDHSFDSRASDKELYLSKILSQFKRFAQLKDIYFYVVAHPKTPRITKEGTLPRPSVFDLSWGAMWNNKSDNILCYDRPYYMTDKSNPLCTFGSDKIKRQKNNGIPGDVEMMFNRKKFRFYEVGFNPLDDYFLRKMKPNGDYPRMKVEYRPDERIESSASDEYASNIFDSNSFDESDPF